MCRPPDVPASGFGRRFMPGFKSRRPRGARRLSVRRADRPHGWYRVQAHAGNVVSDKRSAAASPWRKADDTGPVVLTPIGRFAVIAELQFEIVLEIIRRCTCSESTARLFLGLHRQSARFARHWRAAPAALVETETPTDTSSVPMATICDRHQPGICNINKAIFRS